MSFVKTYEEAKAGFKPMSRNTPLRTKSLIKARRPSKGLKAKTNPELAAWGRRVLDRDGLRCQWPECRFCLNHINGGGVLTLDPHHKALRSARPDLRLIDDNGVTVCRPRHDWIHSPKGHDEAVSRGFLNPRTMELAKSEGTLGVR